VARAKSGISFAYQNAGSMLAACLSIMAVTMVGFSSETKMFHLCRSGWNRTGVDTFRIRGSMAIWFITARPCVRRSWCVLMDPWQRGSIEDAMAGGILAIPLSTRALQYAVSVVP
jgi:hypothetical protein